jgi:hypothetical protein
VTEPVIDAWQRQMKEHKADGGKLIAEARALLQKYANEPEPQPPQSEQKVVAQPAASGPTPQAKVDMTPATAHVPAAPPAAAAMPAPAAASPLKELDIPL